MEGRWSKGIPEIPEIPDDLELSPTATSGADRYGSDSVGSMNIDADTVFIKPDTTSGVGDYAKDQSSVFPLGTKQPDEQLDPKDMVVMLSAIYSELRQISTILLNEFR
jgi:hypothetical protein